MKRLTLVLLPSVLLASLPFAFHATATPYWGEAEIAAWAQAGGADDAGRAAPQAAPAGWAARAASRAARTDYLTQYALIAAFLDTWQVDREGDPNDGGIREGEHLPDIIQTDNTSEAIWVWSRYYELTGDNQYLPNTLSALEYCLRHPAYSEEGGSTPEYGYYRMYNCGWAARAELAYRQAYGDETYRAYGDSCANYIVDQTLSLPADPFYRRVNPPVLAWALGNLYLRGVGDGVAAWRTAAASKAAARIKPWIENDPEILRREIWAMAGGAAIWGLLESYFAAHPESIATWVPLYADSVDTFSSPGEFQNAWNGWYALGHRALGEALDSAYHLGLHLGLTDTLVAEDGDGDGGIPARPEDDDDEDQTWVANYLAFMGLAPLLGAGSAVPELGPIASAGPELWIANPVRGAPAIEFALSAPGPVRCELFDCSGRRLRTLATGHRDAGRHRIAWSGPKAVAKLGAGAYFVRVRTAEGDATGRLLLLP